MKGNGMPGLQDTATQEKLMASLLVCSIPDCNRAARLLHSQGMLSMEKALPSWKCWALASHNLPSPWKHLNFSLSLNFRQCHAVLLGAPPSSIANLQAPGISSEKKNWEFKPWGLGAGGSRSDCRMCSSKTFSQDPVSSRSLKRSQLKPLKAEAGGGFEVTTCSSCCPKCCSSEFAFISVILRPEAAFALRFSLAVRTKHKLYHFHFLKTCFKVPKIKVSYLFCFLGCLFVSSSPFLMLSSGQGAGNSGAALNFSIK